MSATEVTREGRSIDPFARAYTRVRELTAAGQFDQALAAAGGVRPFSASYLLDGARDEDVEWITNGGSIFDWIDWLAANHDN